MNFSSAGTPDRIFLTNASGFEIYDATDVSSFAEESITIPLAGAALSASATYGLTLRHVNGNPGNVLRDADRWYFNDGTGLIGRGLFLGFNNSFRFEIASVPTTPTYPPPELGAFGISQVIDVAPTTFLTFLVNTSASLTLESTTFCTT